MHGAIMTGLQRHMTQEDLNQRGWVKTNPFFKTVEQGAATSVWAAVAPELEGKGGLYLEHCQITPVIPDEVMNQEKLTGFKNGYPFGCTSYALDDENAKRL